MKFKPGITLILFLFGYIWLVHFLIPSDFVGDEGRHATQSLLFKEYFTSGTLSFSEFLNDFSERFYGVGWYALYDPPAHAIIQAITFLVAKPSVASARFLTYLFVFIGGIILYLFSVRLFHNTKDALLSTALFLLLPTVFIFAGQNYLVFPKMALTIAFFYSFIYAQGRARLVLCTIFLALTTMMKYQSIIYMGVFLVVYLSIHKKQPFSDKPWKEEVRFCFFLLFFTALLIFPWAKFSLLDRGYKDILLYTGVTGPFREPFLHGYAFFARQVVIETLGVALLLVIPLWRWIANKKPDDKRMAILLLYVLSTIVVASIVLANQYLRMIIKIFPFVAILSVHAWRQVSEKRWYVPAIVLVLIVLLAYDINMMNEQIPLWGSHNPQLEEFFKVQRDPYLVVIPKGFGISSRPEPGYYLSSDQIVFTALNSGKKTRVRETDHPEPFDDLFAAALIEYPGNVHVVFTVTGAETMRGRVVHNILEEHGYIKTSLEYYEIWSRKGGSDKEFFVSLRKRVKADNLNRQAKSLIEQQHPAQAYDLLEQSWSIDPYNYYTRRVLTEMKNLVGKEAIRRGRWQDAVQVLSDAVMIDQTKQEYKENLAYAKANLQSPDIQNPAQAAPQTI